MKISNPEKIDKSGIKNLIFDWGGVITDIDFVITNNMFAELGFENFIDQFSKYNMSSLLKDFEVGTISPKELFNEFRKSMHNNVSDQQIKDAWMSVLKSTPENRINTLLNLNKKYRTFLLSNTNKIHADQFNIDLMIEQGVNHYSLFEKVYYSHEVGLRKPGKEIYEYVLKDSNLNPAETLFIDDTEPNIDTASSLGIVAFHLSNNHDISEVFKNW